MSVPPLQPTDSSPWVRGTPCRLLERLAQHARARPDAEAFGEAGPRGGEAPRRAITYRVLHERVLALAATLGGEGGAAPGGVVLLSCSNRIEFPIGYLGVLAAGAVVMPLHPRLATPELLAVARQVSAAAIIGSDETIEALAPAGLATVRIGDLLGAGIGIRASGLGSRGSGAGIRNPKPETRNPISVPGPTLLLQSSGTTGAPKVAMRSGASLDAVAGAGACAQGLTNDDRVLACIPLCHSYGMENGLLSPLWAGCSVRLLDGFDGDGGGALVREFRRGATVFPGVPFMFEALATLMGDGLGSGSLRLAYSAGGPMPLAVEARFRGVAGTGVGQLYGATELGLVTFNDPGVPGFDPASVGAPVAGVSVRILDPEDPDPTRPLANGAEGHVAVAAPSMLSGYLGAEAPIVGGHFLTGDLGRLDDCGRLFLTGRLKLLIDVGGVKINPAEIERVLLEHPAVGECVVVPIHLSETVERIRAVLTPAPGHAPGALVPDDLRRFARERLAPHKVPRVFEVRASLPRSPAGKVLRRELEGS